MKRRDFIKTTGGGILGATLAGSLTTKAFAQSPQVGNSNNGGHSQPSYLIDAYTHSVPLEWLTLLEQLWGIPAHPAKALYRQIPPAYDVNARLSQMEKTGVEMSVLVPFNLESSMPVWAVEDKAIQASQFYNNFIADNWVAPHPGKFKAVAVVPSVTQAAMVNELTRAVQEKGCVGAILAAGPSCKPLDHVDYMGAGGLYEKAQQLNVPLWIHPVHAPTIPDYTYPGQPVPSPYYLGSILGWPYDSSIAACRLMFSGVFDKYPDLKLVLHHQGALLPTWWDRIDGMMQFYATTGNPGIPTISKPWIDHAKKFYVDTCCPGMQPGVFKLAYDFFGPDHCLFGTDTPMDYTLDQSLVSLSLASIQANKLGAKAEQKIYSNNVLAILP